MPWNPDIYNQFKTIRYQPFFDLMDLIYDENLENAVDLGCGTGEQTKILSENFRNTNFLGVDSSAEMLEKSKSFENNRLHFEQSSVEKFIDSNKKYDLIFSNAALQWSDNHLELFPSLFSMLSENGQFAVQMPVQHENRLNQILYQLASEEPYRTQLNSWNRASEVLSMDQYVHVMFENGLSDLQVFTKVYPIVAKDEEELFAFISGSALIPYLERLNEDKKNIFTSEFKRRIQQDFQKFPAIYSFKRLLIYGRV